MLSKSASGGVFATIAEQFIKSGGWVCGSVMEFKKGIATCYHRVTNKLNDIEKMQGSKYVQSDITDALPEIKQLISKKEKILFAEHLVRFQQSKKWPQIMMNYIQ